MSKVTIETDFITQWIGASPDTPPEQIADLVRRHIEDRPSATEREFYWVSLGRFLLNVIDAGVKDR